MERKIEMYFEYEDNDLIMVYLTDESDNSIISYIKEYNLLDYCTEKDDSIFRADLYNTMIDDFDAEYDDALANVINKLVEKL